KGTRLEEPLDAIVIGIPPTTAFIPRSRPNPVAAAYLGLGVALRSWRNRFPVRPGGTAILLHDFQRRFPPSQAPYRALFAAPRSAWRAAPAPSGSAICSRRRTSRCSWAPR